jgi:hypothetical protein
MIAESVARGSTLLRGGELLDDLLHAVRLEHDLRPVALRLVRELRAQLIDVHVLRLSSELAPTGAPRDAP